MRVGPPQEGQKRFSGFLQILRARGRGGQSGGKREGGGEETDL